jgi:hypothetical protein
MLQVREIEGVNLFPNGNPSSQILSKEIFSVCKAAYLGRTAAPTATATIATGVAIMMTLSPQMEGQVAGSIFAA